jgi:hypothetical protein
VTLGHAMKAIEGHRAFGAISERRYDRGPKAVG